MAARLIEGLAVRLLRDAAPRADVVDAGVGRLLQRALVALPLQPLVNGHGVGALGVVDELHDDLAEQGRLLHDLTLGLVEPGGVCLDLFFLVYTSINKCCVQTLDPNPKTQIYTV